jgi:hypothetical protein
MGSRKLPRFRDVGAGSHEVLHTVISETPGNSQNAEDSDGHVDGHVVCVRLCVIGAYRTKYVCSVCILIVSRFPHHFQYDM